MRACTCTDIIPVTCEALKSLCGEWMAVKHMGRNPLSEQHRNALPASPSAEVRASQLYAHTHTHTLARRLGLNMKRLSEKALKCLTCWKICFLYMRSKSWAHFIYRRWNNSNSNSGCGAIVFYWASMSVLWHCAFIVYHWLLWFAAEMCFTVILKWN